MTHLPLHKKMQTLLARHFACVRSLVLLLLLPLLLASCFYAQPNRLDHWTSGTEGEVDSVQFRISHHYWTGYNFCLTDTLRLSVVPPAVGNLPDLASYLTCDSVALACGDRIVVADVVAVPGEGRDTLWVKVARDQLTQGWTSEVALLERAVPDDPISQFVYRFSDRRTVVVVCVMGLMLLFVLLQSVRRRRFRMVHFGDIPSFYPTLLCLLVSGSAALYGSMQGFAPATWEEFYFHPTLNPFRPDLPLVLSLFVASVWALLVGAVAAVQEVRRQCDLREALSYLSTLAAVCAVLYLVFTLTTPVYVGYPLLAAYWGFALWRYANHRPSHLVCGMCRRPIAGPGRCPHCGTVNR